MEKGKGKMKLTEMHVAWRARYWFRWDWKPHYQCQLFSNKTIKMRQFTMAWVCVAVTWKVKVDSADI